MKIKFLGTGASEGIPDIFCDCPVCREARKSGGKEARTRAGVLIDDTLLMDFSPDFFANSIKYGIDGKKIGNILITHSHSDHFAIEDIVYSMLGSKDRGTVDIYSNETVLERLKNEAGTRQVGSNFRLHNAESYVTFRAGKYEITAFEAVHMPAERALLFFIDDGKSGYLHLYDTGEVKEEVVEWLRANKKTANVVAFDCTFGTLETNYYGHMNLSQVKAECDRLEKNGILAPGAQVFATHICHWGGTHADLCKAVDGTNIKIAFDGAEVIA